MMSEQKQKQTEKSALPPFFFSPSSTSSSLYLINIHCIWSFFVFPGGHPRRRNHPSISADLFETHEGTHILQVREREKEEKRKKKTRKRKKKKKGSITKCFSSIIVFLEHRFQWPFVMFHRAFPARYRLFFFFFWFLVCWCFSFYHHHHDVFFSVAISLF